MTEVEICITCGEELIPGFIIQDEMIMLCPNCDDDEEYETHQDEDPWKCLEGDATIFCPWCF